MSERLKVFLPQLAKANAVLAEETSELEDVDEEGEYIEMVSASDENTADLESRARSIDGERQ